MGTTRNSQQGYGLATPIYNVFQSPIVSKTRGPTTSDQAEIGTLWIWNMGVTSQAWVLGAVVANVATWIPIGNGMGLTVEANDTTTATPAAGILKIFGLNADGLTTTAAGSTLTVETVPFERPAFLAYQPASTSGVTGNSAIYTLGNDPAGVFTAVKDTTGSLALGGGSPLTYTVPQSGMYMLQMQITFDSGSTYEPLYMSIVTTMNTFHIDLDLASKTGGGSLGYTMSVVAYLFATNTVTYNCVATGQGANSTVVEGDVAPYLTYVSGALIS